MFTMITMAATSVRAPAPTRSLRARRVPRAKGSPRRVKQAGIIGIRSKASRLDDAPCDVDASRPTVTRREAFSSLAALGATMIGAAEVAHPAPALAAYGADAGGLSAGGSSGEDVTWSTFYGAAAPPATYGYLGGTTKDKAKYSYEVPSDWVEEAPSKVEKGAGGQDSRWVKTGSRGAINVKCLTLNRAGEDGAAFGLTDKALQAIAGADSKLQESINSGTVSSAKSGDYVTFTISGGTGGDYAVKITIDNTGRLFAFVASTPSDKYKGETKKTLDRMVGSFRTYESVSQFV